MQTLLLWKSLRFNRYMVECEFYSFYFCIFKAEVLIDTWWNVNMLEKFMHDTQEKVLIDTWWNVNAVGRVQ